MEHLSGALPRDEPQTPDPPPSLLYTSASRPQHVNYEQGHLDARMALRLPSGMVPDTRGCALHRGYSTALDKPPAIIHVVSDSNAPSPSPLHPTSPNRFKPPQVPLSGPAAPLFLRHLAINPWLRNGCLSLTTPSCRISSGYGAVLSNVMFFWAGAEVQQ
ncbi:hypothetical protein BDK51DRAFT_40491 [Blyttiomyces helicus]|uniref:Uncharacterized protein n=1 Tax=Blyttiomyces helicus TaxID=388810 RepID=A0A4P9VVH5_9FUNG|nr:hypothetical protein BDK51DRAFT_40491 [Blyttiomyces helicus]|eukprot:RKO83651.1 hypothetical protein BDK51DRAFT_40491 [Blyttiomyces helicus]